MSPQWWIGLIFLAAYLLGGIPFGLLIARAKGLDIRRHGSGNVGATNVGRVLGRKWGVFVFALDLSKGAASTYLSGVLAHRLGGAASTQLDWIWLGAGLACVLGSVAPVYLRFRGGKGVAASLGALLGIFPYLTLPAIIVFVIWAVVVKATGYVSLGSMVAAASLPLVFAGLAWRLNWDIYEHFPLLGLCLAMTLTVLIRHRDNLGRLLAGTENKSGHQPDSPSTAIRPLGPSGRPSD